MNIYFTEKVLAIFFIILFSPLFLLFSIMIKITSDGPAIFKQKRSGKDKKPFTLYKFRTMTYGSDKILTQVRHLNEANGPVFKIYNDPRFTHVGRFLAHTGLDELPQLMNILKGEMAFVGPRPLPLYESKYIPKKYIQRFSVLPGITSLWVVNRNQKTSFRDRMNMDIEYVKNKKLYYDMKIAFKTIGLVFSYIAKSI